MIAGFFQSQVMRRLSLRITLLDAALQTEVLNSGPPERKDGKEIIVIPGVGIHEFVSARGTAALKSTGFASTNTETL
jgi:hypothetical protein